eukprot:Sdes_comp20487_c0_seq1m14874
MTAKKGGLRLCSLCELVKPDRTHHCSICKACVLKMDHHCAWINNCVGFHNYKYFVVFLFHSVGLCLVCFLSSRPFAFQILNHSERAPHHFHMLALFLLSCIFGIATLILLLFHLHLLSTNTTTLEYMQPPCFAPAGAPNPAGFHLGALANIHQVLGRNPVYWLLPINNSLGSGFVFPVSFPSVSASHASQDAAPLKVTDGGVFCRDSEQQDDLGDLGDLGDQEEEVDRNQHESERLIGFQV